VAAGDGCFVVGKKSLFVGGYRSRNGPFGVVSTGLTQDALGCSCGDVLLLSMTQAFRGNVGLAHLRM